MKPYTRVLNMVLEEFGMTPGYGSLSFLIRIGCEFKREGMQLWEENQRKIHEADLSFPSNSREHRDIVAEQQKWYEREMQYLAAKYARRLRFSLRGFLKHYCRKPESEPVPGDANYVWKGYA